MNELLRDWKKLLGVRGELFYNYKQIRIQWGKYLKKGTLSWQCIPLTGSQYEFKRNKFLGSPCISFLLRHFW